MFSPLLNKTSRKDNFTSVAMQITNRREFLKDAYMEVEEKEFHRQILDTLQDTIKQISEYSHVN